MTPSPRALLYRWYVRRLSAALTSSPGRLPRHVAVVMDGNRRWARQAGYADPSIGHRFGAEHVDDLLGWCAAIGVGHVTVYVASADNLRKRDADEVGHLMRMIEEVVSVRLSDPAHRWRLHVAGRLDLLPDSTRDALKLAISETADRSAGLELTVAIGYDAPTSRTAATPSGSRPTTSPATSTPTACPTPTSSSAPAASSGCPASCCGSPLRPSCTSATPTGPASARSTSSARCGRTPARAVLGSGRRHHPPGGRRRHACGGRAAGPAGTA
jgi:hypothetical protein